MIIILCYLFISWIVLAPVPLLAQETRRHLLQLIDFDSRLDRLTF